MNTKLEIAMFRFMVDENRRERFEWHLSSPKRRDKIFDDLRDTRCFDESKIHEVDHPYDVVQFMEEHEAIEDIYIVSSGWDIDGQTVSIKELGTANFWNPNEIVGFCKSAKVGFFKNHEDWYYVIKSS